MDIVVLVLGLGVLQSKGQTDGLLLIVVQQYRHHHAACAHVVQLRTSTLQLGHTPYKSSACSLQAFSIPHCKPST